MQLNIIFLINIIRILRSKVYKEWTIGTHRDTGKNRVTYIYHSFQIIQIQCTIALSSIFVYFSCCIFLYVMLTCVLGFVFGRKIARAILILIPLLGLQNLTMAVKFDSVYYRYFAAVMSSYQVCPLWTMKYHNNEYWYMCTSCLVFTRTDHIW